MNDFSITNSMMPKFNNVNSPEFNNTLNGYISNKVNLAEDKELMQDLNTILKDSSTSEAENIANTFSNTIGNVLNDTNKKHEDAANAIKTFASGGDIDIHSVMIAQEKANLSMQLTMQFRNKLLSAYKEISNIRV